MAAAAASARSRGQDERVSEDERVSDADWSDEGDAVSASALETALNTSFPRGSEVALTGTGTLAASRAEHGAACSTMTGTGILRLGEQGAEVGAACFSETGTSILLGEEGTEVCAVCAAEGRQPGMGSTPRAEGCTADSVDESTRTGQAAAPRGEDASGLFLGERGGVAAELRALSTRRSRVRLGSCATSRSIFSSPCASLLCTCSSPLHICSLTSESCVYRSA